MTRVDALTGPTACGKSAVALLLAQERGAEIVSADSMKIYKRMPVMTAQPSPDERARVAHHLVERREPDEPCSAGEFARLALEVIGDVVRHGARALVEGGSVLYLRALVEGLAEAPARDEKLRAHLAARARREGSEALHAELSRVDPAAAAKIHPNDLRRITRALEVHALSGRPISHDQKWGESLREGYDFRVVAIHRDREDLYGRIERRADAMLEAGLIEEVRALAGSGAVSKEAAGALGYAQVKGQLDGAYDMAEARRLLIRDTRAFARRQERWLRRLPYVRWVEVAPEEPVDSVAARVEAAWEANATPGA